MPRRFAFLVAALALSAAACGPAGPLDGVGKLSASWLAPATTTTSTIAVAAGSGDMAMVASVDVLWFNDDLDGQVTGDANTVIAGVWARRAASRFVQASRREIAAALPTIEFPARLPIDVRWVTSQLVFDEATAGLDVDTSAAFGFWLDEPYATSEARSMVLRVGLAPADAPPTRSDITPILVPQGITLVWTNAGLRYELFCRSSVGEDLCRQVAESSVPLSTLMPDDGGTA